MPKRLLFFLHPEAGFAAMFTTPFTTPFHQKITPFSDNLC
jgi:hypothetical protein